MLGLLLVGCESVPEVIDRHRAAVERTFASISALAPRVASATVEPPASLSLRLEGAEANAMFVYAEDVARPGEARPVTLRTLDSVPLLQCGALLSKGVYFNDAVNRPRPGAVEALLQDCARLRYVLIIRQRAYEPPRLSLATRSFSRGKYEAEVLAFELASGKPLGGYEARATNDERVSLLDGDDHHEQRLLSNLEGTVFQALRAGARTAFPGSLPPPRR